MPTRDGELNRRRPAMHPQGSPAEAGEQHIVYISGHSSCEQDMAENLLRVLFGRSVLVYSWDLRDLHDNLSASYPLLIIFSTLLQDMGVMPKDVWKAVRDMFPQVPMLWLTPDPDYLPDFLAAEGFGVRVESTMECESPIEQIATAVTELTGLKPLLDLAMFRRKR